MDFAWYLGFGDVGWSTGNRLFRRSDCQVVDGCGVEGIALEGICRQEEF